MSTDHEWERWGASDPYFGVLTNPKFRTASLTPEARAEFFYSGRCHVSAVLDTCRRVIDPAFAPQSVLDFGCGVGRLLIPFAAAAQHVVGMDIAPSMLAEARRNCDEQGVGNVELAASDDSLSAAPGPFDLVHTAIVLQHIEVARGRLLFERLVERIRPGGVGALHVTFAWDLFASTFGQWPPPPPPPPPPTWTRLTKDRIREQLGLVKAAEQVPPAAGSADPEMQMNFYNLSELLFVLQLAGVQRLHIELTDHGGAFGAFLYFQKPALAVSALGDNRPV
jgi:SAM-dependent methyltransferase